MSGLTDIHEKRYHSLASRPQYADILLRGDFYHKQPFPHSLPSFVYLVTLTYNRLQTCPGQPAGSKGPGISCLQVIVDPLLKEL